MWPLRLSTSTSLTLCSGATRAITPISLTCSAACSSLSAANSAPVTARPSMPSSLAIAAAVMAWSPRRGGGHEDYWQVHGDAAHDRARRGLVAAPHQYCTVDRLRAQQLASVSIARKLR